jgi:hypothetical protein
VQLSQYDAPSKLWYLPAGQSSQPVIADVGVYFPASQLLQLSTADVIENFPTEHAVHVLAPAVEPVLVIEPAEQELQSASSSEPSASAYSPAMQSVQAATLDEVEYLPLAHTVHVIAPAAVPLFVIEPAAHSAQDPSLELVDHLPDAHRLHSAAPRASPLPVIEPAWQSMQ